MKRDSMDWLSGMTGPLFRRLGSNGASLERTLELRQTEEVWECTVRRAHVWISPPDREPARPWIVLTMSEDGRVRGSEVVEHEPTPADVIHALAKAMRQPAPGSGGRRRPSVIHLDDAVLVGMLTPELEKVGIRCVFRQRLPEAELALQDLWSAFDTEGSISGLLEARGVTPLIIEGIFEAAAAFYREAPWRWISDSHAIEIRYPLDSPPRYAVVMGHAGETYGLAIYNSIDFLRETYAGTPLDHLIGQDTWTALLFEEAVGLPFDDLDGIEAYGWPVAGRHAYPLPIRVGLSGTPTRPGRSDLLRMEAALLSVPRFVRAHLKAAEGPPLSAEETLTIEMTGRVDQIRLRYPVPGLEQAADRDAVSTEMASVRDRNAELLNIFCRWLTSQGLSAEMAQMHLDNADRFATRYLRGEGGSLGIPCAADKATPADIDEFLADWLPTKTDQPVVRTVESHINSLRQLYLCLKETEQMSAAESTELLALLRDDRDYFLDMARGLES